MMNLKKIADRLIRIIFWWPIAFWKVCKKQARFEGLLCIAICVMFLAVGIYFFRKGGIDFKFIATMYLSFGCIFSGKIFFYSNTPEQNKTLQEQKAA